MKVSLLLLLLFGCFTTSWTQQYQYFEGNNNNLPVSIDTMNNDNLWVIGQPSKTIFNQAISAPNAIITDSILDYNGFNNSSFTIELDMDLVWMFPYAILGFNQSMETDSTYAGGWIEASYDSGTTWRNILTDQVYPVVVYPMNNVAMLQNGEMGFTGSFHNIWSSVCFLPISFQNPQPPYASQVLMRFNFFADSTAIPDEGWMLDNFEFFPEIIHIAVDLEEMSVSEYSVIFPNPVRDRLNIFVRAEKQQNITLQLIDVQGKLHRTIDKGLYQKGLHTLELNKEVLRDLPNLFFVRVVMDEEVFVHKVMKF